MKIESKKVRLALNDIHRYAISAAHQVQQHVDDALNKFPEVALDDLFDLLSDVCTDLETAIKKVETLDEVLSKELRAQQAKNTTWKDIALLNEDELLHLMVRLGVCNQNGEGLPEFDNLHCARRWAAEKVSVEVPEKVLLPDHYNQTLNPHKEEWERYTRTEVLALKAGQEVHFITNQGKVARAKLTGKVRTWKKDENRVEVPLKFGMYDSFVLDLHNACTKLVKPLHF